MKCTVCRSTGGRSIKFDFPFYRHLDFTRVADSGEIFRCNKCYGLSFDGKFDIDTIYKGDDYIKERRTCYVVIKDDPKDSCRDYELRAEFLSKRVGMDSAILDIGCFNGKLLKELRKRFGKAELYGFDVSTKHKQFFQDSDRINYHHSDLSNIDAQFDLITIVNVLNYVGDMQKFIANLKRLLNKDGLIYIETVDIDKNPCPILYGDLYTYYNTNLLSNLFTLYGLRFEGVENSWSPRSISGVVRVDSAHSEGLVDDRGVFNCLAYLNNLRDGILKLCKKRKIKVLGTSLNASLIYDFVPEGVECFIDENPSKVGTDFKGLRVMHPCTLGRHDLLVVAYGATGLKIKERFEERYPCEIVCF